MWIGGGVAVVRVVVVAVEWWWWWQWLGSSGVVGMVMLGRWCWCICAATAEWHLWRRGIGSGAGAAANADALLSLHCLAQLELLGLLCLACIRVRATDKVLMGHGVGRVGGQGMDNAVMGRSVLGGFGCVVQWTMLLGAGKLCVG
jgi:hypothetical protein